LGFLAVRRLERRVNRREQRQHRDAQLHAVFGHGQQQVQAQAVHAGHGGHGLAAVGALVHEHGVDQVIGGDHVLAHQAAGEGIAAQAAGAVLGEGGRALEVHHRIMKPSLWRCASVRAPVAGGRAAVVGASGALWKSRL